LGGPLDEENRDQARAEIVNGPEIASSIETAQNFVNRALSTVEDLPATPGVQGMRDAATNLLSALNR
ncbi:MAG: hypothetical protein ACPHL4_04890, partial [Acidimicrobiales bacterium]